MVGTLNVASGTRIVESIKLWAAKACGLVTKTSLGTVSSGEGGGGMKVLLAACKQRVCCLERKHSLSP